MNRGEIERLLGGYATGTLTAAEQKALYEAALEDQQIFDLLAQEEALAELFRDPSLRGELLASLDDKRPSWWAAWWRPAAAVLAVACLTVAVLFTLRKTPQSTPPQILADARSPLPVEAPRAITAPKSPAAAPAAVPERRTAVPPHDAEEVASDKKAKVAARDEVKLEAPPVLKEEKDSALAKADLPAQSAGAPAAAPVLSPATQTVAVNDAVRQAEAARQGAQTLFFADNSPAAAQGYVAGGQQGQSQVQVRAEGARLDTLQQQQQKTVAPQAEEKQQQTARNEQVPLPALRTMATAAAPAPYAGVRYRIQRQRKDSTFEEADPESLKTGDVIRLEFTPNDRGHLTVTAARRTVLSTEVDRFRAYYTATLPPEYRELLVTFQPRQAPGSPGGAGPTTVVHQTVSSDNYVVNTASTPLMFTIRLNYR
jgi:hypothetical protein